MSLPYINFRPVYESPITKLDGAIDDTQTTITLTSVADIGEHPNILVIWETGKREIVKYDTAPTGNVLTVERGYGDSTANSFGSGASVSRVLSYLDIENLQLNQEYLDGKLPVGDVVGTSDVQTLTGKVIDGDDNTIQDLSYSAIKATSRSGIDGTLITGTKGTDGNLAKWNADGDLVDSKTPPTGDIVGTTDTQTVTNKTIDANSNSITNIGSSEIDEDIITGLTELETPADNSDLLLVYDTDVETLKKIAINNLPFIPTSDAPTGDIVGTSDVQSLTNKTFTTPKINEDVELTTTSTELNYVNGVTSSIQTQLDGKAATSQKLDDFGIPDDNTDLNATTTHHGLLPKLGGGTTDFLRADGTWSAPDSVASDGIWNATGDLAVGTGNGSASVLSLGDAGKYLKSNGTSLEYSDPLESPTLTGVPLAPTAPVGTDTTQIATTAFVQTATRELLTADRTYYVATTGNDTTGDGSSGNPWATIQHTYDYITTNVDTAGYTVTIQLADGTYSAGVYISNTFVGDGSTIIQGNTGNQDAVYISAESAVYLNSPASNITTRYLKVLKLKCDAGSLTYNNIDFVGSIYHIEGRGTLTRIFGQGVSTISSSCLCHIWMGSGAYGVFYGGSITLSGTPAFSSAFIFSDVFVYAEFGANTFTGSATGTRYGLYNISILRLGGSTLPGDVAGSYDSTSVVIV